MIFQDAYAVGSVQKKLACYIAWVTCQADYMESRLDVSAWASGKLLEKYGCDKGCPSFYVPIFVRISCPERCTPFAADIRRMRHGLSNIT